MRFWIDLEAVPENPGSTTLYGTPQYLELREPSDVGGTGVSFTYVIQLDPHSYIVASCWNHEFDRFVPFIFDERLGGDWIEAYGEAWPMFSRLLRNTQSGRLSDGCLVNFEDLDVGERKWFVVTYVGNIPATDEWMQVAQNDRILDACRVVYLRSAELLTQMGNGSDVSGVTKAKMYAKGIFASHAATLDTSLVWLERFDKLASILQ